MEPHRSFGVHVSGKRKATAEEQAVIDKCNQIMQKAIDEMEPIALAVNMDIHCTLELMKLKDDDIANNPNVAQA